MNETLVPKTWNNTMKYVEVYFPNIVKMKNNIDKSTQLTNCTNCGAPTSYINVCEYCGTINL